MKIKLSPKELFGIIQEFFDTAGVKIEGPIEWKAPNDKIEYFEVNVITEKDDDKRH